MPIIKKFDVPKTRDPFVNTPLIPAGIDPLTGEERFFISTWNANVGSLSALITPSGIERIYRFMKGEGICGCGAYSAVLSDNDTMWLCSDLSYVVRLSLSLGEYNYYPTGARSGLVFCGMQFDDITGKLLFMANACSCLCAVSFDTKRQKTVYIYDDFTKATLGDGGFSNGDGTYTLRLTTGFSSLYRWNPKKESLTQICEINENAQCSRVIFDEKECAFIPMEGWLLPNGTFSDSPRPQIEKRLWFGRTANKAYGAEESSDGVEVYSWDFDTKEVKPVCHVPDGTPFGLALTKKGEILAVSLFGEVYKYNRNGLLLMTKTLQSDAQGHIDCLMSIEENCLLGTPFISQRFWLLDLLTNQGIDAGRAATKCGEVLRVWKKADKIYMASYTEGILTEFDPKKLPTFPENPRIVATAPNGMRPVADAQDEDCLYYSCNHHYGILGCVLTRYNTRTGETVYLDNPLDFQHIISLLYDKKDDYLLATSTFRSDCDVTEVKSSTCYILMINKYTLEIREKIALPNGTNFARFIGAIKDNYYLFSQIDENDLCAYYLYDANEKKVSSLEKSLEACNLKQLKYTNTINQFVGLTDTEVSLWEISENRLVKTKSLLQDTEVYSVFGEANRVLAATAKHIYVIDSVNY